MTKEKPYQPSQKVLQKYADILVNFAVNNGKGIRCGDTVMITGAEVTKPLFMEVYKKAIDAGAHVMTQYVPNELSNKKYLLEQGSPKQIGNYQKHFYDGIIKETDHHIYLLAEFDPTELNGLNPKKIMTHARSMKPYRDARQKKENEGKFSWTLALYATEQSAKEACMDLKSYWKEIIKGCYLDKKDPVQEWKEVYKQLDKHKRALNKITAQTAQFHMTGSDMDLWITPGSERQWIRSTGQNIPSYELFLSPDWRGTEGWIKFNQPLYRYGNLITDIELHFKNGQVVKSSASQGQSVLQSMIKETNADKIGEFSLTDKRYSRITKFMAETLFDENIGGKYGNPHIALGSSFHDTWTRDQSRMTPILAKKLGFNDSVVHTDIMSTTDRTVTAYLHDGTAKVIYKDGMYQV